MNYLTEHYKNQVNLLQEQYNFLKTVICLLETSEADKILDIMMGYGGRKKPHSFESLSKEQQDTLRRATAELRAKEEARNAARQMSPEERARRARNAPGYSGSDTVPDTPTSTVRAGEVASGDIKKPSWGSRNRRAIPKLDIYKTPRWISPTFNQVSGSFAKPYEILPLDNFNYEKLRTPVETSYDFVRQTGTPPQAPPAAPPIRQTGTPPQAPPAAPPKSGVRTPKSTGIGTKLGTIGAGLATGYVADEAARAALSAAGIENETAQNVAGTAANVGVGAGTEIALGGLAKGVGTRAALGLGLKAIPGYAVGGALGQLAGDYVVKPLASIEYKLPGEKGNAKSTIDRLGQELYDPSIVTKTLAPGIQAVQMATNWMAGNKLTASTKDLNEKPKGIVGGDPTKIAQNQREDEEERLALEKKTAERNARIAAKVSQFQAQR